MFEKTKSQQDEEIYNERKSIEREREAFNLEKVSVGRSGSGARSNLGRLVQTRKDRNW